MEDAYEIREGDCREVMRGMDAESIDAIVCDPPYGLSFMGKGWDHGVPGVEFWTEPMGEAARFFYCAKASKADRGDGNNHPTVKPTALMRYLCRLVTQPGGIVLDPFCGSGSTGKAALLEGFRFIGIERESDYAAIARARIAAVKSRHE
jgi:DNA modification methylase